MDHLLFTIPIPKHPIHVTLWTLFGLTANLLFTGRVLVQWAASERARRTVVPVAFWWMSVAAAAIMIVYAACKPQPEIPFIIGNVIALVPYLRNLIIAYRPDRPPRQTRLVLASALILGAVSIALYWDKQGIKDGWFYIGLAGNAIFGSRFLLQWVQSEVRRRSVMTLPFWYVSLGGSLILLIYSLVRGDLVFILGFIFNVIPYGRNIMLLHRERRLAGAEPASPLACQPSGE